LGDLPRHGAEDRAGRGALRNQRGDATKRRLLLGQAVYLGARFGVRDRRGQELGELADPQLGVRWQGGLVRAGREHGAP
jgi:hypothetical protein